jgi:hypothetical protein
MLDRPLILPFDPALVFLSFGAQDLILLFREACLTLELTGRDEPPIKTSLAHESNAIRAPVE